MMRFDKNMVSYTDLLSLSCISKSEKVFAVRTRNNDWSQGIENEVVCLKPYTQHHNRKKTDVINLSCCG